MKLFSHYHRQKFLHSFQALTAVDLSDMKTFDLVVSAQVYLKSPLKMIVVTLAQLTLLSVHLMLDNCTIALFEVSLSFHSETQREALKSPPKHLSCCLQLVPSRAVETFFIEITGNGSVCLEKREEICQMRLLMAV